MSGNYQPGSGLEPPVDENVSFAEDWDEFRDQITDLWRTLSRKVNDKERAFYPDRLELTNSQKFFTAGNPQKYREAFRKVFNIGAIATGATLNNDSTAHGITRIGEFTRIYGVCTTDVVDYRPIPYSSVTAANLGIELNVTATNVVIINGAAAPNITSGIVVIEYVKT